jgi:hypothetical protein
MPWRWLIWASCATTVVEGYPRNNGQTVYWYRKAAEGGGGLELELGKPAELLWIHCIDNLGRTPYTETLPRTEKA